MAQHKIPPYGKPKGELEQLSKKVVEDHAGKRHALDLYALHQEFTVDSKAPWHEVKNYLHEALGAIAHKKDLTTHMTQLIFEKYPPEEFNTQ